MGDLVDFAVVLEVVPDVVVAGSGLRGCAVRYESYTSNNDNYTKTYKAKNVNNVIMKENLILIWIFFIAA